MRVMLTDKHGSTGSNLRPVTFEELDDCDVVEVEHGRKVLNLLELKDLKQSFTVV